MPSKKQETSCAARWVFSRIFQRFSSLHGYSFYSILRGLFQGLLPWRTDARGHESNSVSLSFFILSVLWPNLDPAFLSPWSYSSTALDTCLTLDILATPLMSIGPLICLKLGMFLSVSTGSENMGLRSLASVQADFSWKSQTSLSSDVDLSWCSDVYLQQALGKKGL